MKNPPTYHFHRTRKLLESLGYAVDKTEHWVPFGMQVGAGAKALMKTPGFRKDLFGIVDGVALNSAGSCIFFQVTSQTGVSARKKKSREREYKFLDGKLIKILKAMILSGVRFVVIGWRKDGNRWNARVVEAYLDNDGNIDFEKWKVLDQGGLFDEAGRATAMSK